MLRFHASFPCWEERLLSDSAEQLRLPKRTMLGRRRERCAPLRNKKLLFVREATECVDTGKRSPRIRPVWPPPAPSNCHMGWQV